MIVSESIVRMKKFTEKSSFTYFLLIYIGLHHKFPEKSRTFSQKLSYKLNRANQMQDILQDQWDDSILFPERYIRKFGRKMEPPSLPSFIPSVFSIEYISLFFSTCLILYMNLNSSIIAPCH